MTGKQFAKVLKSGKCKLTSASLARLSEEFDTLIDKYNLKHFCITREPWVPGKPLLKSNLVHAQNGYITFATMAFNYGLSKLIESLNSSDM